MGPLNQQIAEYTRLLGQGRIQPAYRGILSFLAGLRAAFAKDWPQVETSALYQGYMDMSYFAVATKPLKDKGLKVAIVYLHEKGGFEAWLSARNRETAGQYGAWSKQTDLEGVPVFHDPENPDAILECTLCADPDFEHPDQLTEKIQQGAEAFLKAAGSLLEK